MQPDRRRYWRYQVDAGWAWVVCFASFFAHSVLFGTIQSFGTLFISLLNEFKSGESATGKHIISYGCAYFNISAIGILLLIDSDTCTVYQSIYYNDRVWA